MNVYYLDYLENDFGHISVQQSTCYKQTRKKEGKLMRKKNTHTHTFILLFDVLTMIFYYIWLDKGMFNENKCFVFF
jgi:hypothetical protein